MLRFKFLMVAALAIVSLSAFANDIAGLASCRGLKSYDVLRAISAYAPTVPTQLSEIEKFTKNVDNRVSYFIDDDGSWGLQPTSLLKKKPVERMYVYCNPSRSRKQCPRNIETKLFGFFISVAEMKYDGKPRNNAYPIEVKIVTTFSLNPTRASTWFWLMRDPESECLVPHAKSANGQLVPFNLSFFAAEKDVGAKHAGIWRLDPKDLFRPFTSSTPFSRLSVQPLE